MEQNAKESLALADRGYLIENGKIVGSGSAEQLKSDPAVQRAYLGLAGGSANQKYQRMQPEETTMNQISLLLENRDVQAIDGVTFDRLNSDHGGHRDPRRGSADRGCDPRRRCRRRGVSGLVGDSAPTQRR